MRLVKLRQTKCAIKPKLDSFVTGMKLFNEFCYTLSVLTRLALYFKMSELCFKKGWRRLEILYDTKINSLTIEMYNFMGRHKGF